MQPPVAGSTLSVESMVLRVYSSRCDTPPASCTVPAGRSNKPPDTSKCSYFSIDMKVFVAGAAAACTAAMDAGSLPLLTSKRLIGVQSGMGASGVPQVTTPVAGSRNDGPRPLFRILKFGKPNFCAISEV